MSPDKALGKPLFKVTADRLMASAPSPALISMPAILANASPVLTSLTVTLVPLVETTIASPEEVVGLNVWTVPNLVTFVRLAGVPLFLWLVLGAHADGWAVTVLAIGGTTDWVDGFLARRLGQVSRLGELLDPLADRLYIVATVIALAAYGWHTALAGRPMFGTLFPQQESGRHA